MIDVRYAAGLFDGEGCVRIAHAKAKQPSRMQVYCAIAITNRPVVDAMKETFGGSVFYDSRKKEYDNYKRKPQHTWVVVSIQAFNFLSSIYPYSIIKKEEIKLAFEFQESINKWRGKLGTKSPSSFTEERAAVYANRADIAKRMSELKKVEYRI